MHDNPPAFPNTGNSTWSMTPEKGMTLRDWFAGQALAMLADSNGDLMLSEYARKAYLLADAMLAERARVEAQEAGNG